VPVECHGAPGGPPEPHGQLYQRGLARSVGLAANATATFTLTLTTPAVFSIGGILAYAESPTPDPDLFNNFGVALIITS